MVTELLGFLKSSGTSTSQAARLWRNDWNIEDAGVEALVTSDPEHAHHVGFMRLIKDCLESNDPESMAHGDYDLFSKINQKDIC